MSDDATPRLALPYLAAAQAQKHVTLNEALALLDSLVQSAVASRTTAAAPASPVDGVLYLLPPGVSGATWNAFTAGDLVRFEAGAWSRLAPPEGLLAYVADEGRFIVRTAGGWAELETALRRVANLERLGVGTAPDDTDRMAVASSSVRFSHIGGDLRLKLNKAAVSGTGSIVFQTGFSGRAECGLTGSDDFAVKVSADGASWREAIRVTNATGAVSFGAGLKLASLVKADLPGASDAGAGALLFVTDEAGGATPVFSDGTSWRRVADRAVVA